MMMSPSSSLLLASLLLLSCASSTSSPPYILLLGYLNGGVNTSIFSMDATTGLITPYPNITNASFFMGDAQGWMQANRAANRLYVANHASVGGGVSLLTIQRDATTSNIITGFTYIDFYEQVYPANPVHLTLSPSEDALFTVSYNDASFNTYSVNPSDGTLMVSLSRISACPNAHQVLLTPNTKYSTSSIPSYSVLVPCLGNDGFLTDITGDGCIGGAGNVCNGNAAFSRPGSGPRHLAIHPTLPKMYAMNEKDSSIATWLYDASLPQMYNPTYISALPPDAPFAGNKSYWAGAEIYLSKNAQFLYVSNRALVANLSSNIGVFRVDTQGNIVGAIQFTTGDGDVNFPRHFTVTPDEKFLIVANQHGVGSLTVFSMNATDGTLTKVGPTIPAAFPNQNPGFIYVLPTPPPPPSMPASSASRVGGGRNTLYMLEVVLFVVCLAQLVSAFGR